MSLESEVKRIADNGNHADQRVDGVVGVHAGLCPTGNTKPFGLPELRARIGALLRRSGGPSADTAGRLSLGPIGIDVGRRMVTVAGNRVDLTPREYELLKTMISQPGRLLTRGRLLRAVWGVAYGDEAHYLHVYVSRLRRKLDAADPTGQASGLIVAEPGVGYRIAEADTPT